MYEWKMSGFFKKIDPNDAAQVINSCADENGSISAKAIVDASRPKDAVLHPCFEWDDTIAAEKWRERQAMKIVQHLVVVIDSQELETDSITVRAFGETRDGGYKSINVIMADPNDKDYLLSIALKELRAFQSKYKNLTELGGVFDEIDKINFD